MGQLVLGLFCAEHHRFEPRSTGDFLSISSVLPFTLYCMNSFSYSVFLSPLHRPLAQEVEQNEKKRLTLTKIANGIIIVIILLSQYLNMELK